MGLWDNIVLAVASLKSRKMRALLTMLGIIIGIGSVIAIVTVGDSLTGSITTSMAGLGASNITVSLTEKSSEDEESETFGVGGYMFGRSSPEESDLISEEMIAEYRYAYSSFISSIQLTESAGSAEVTNKDSSASVSITGVNADYFTDNELDIKTGRLIKQEDIDGEKKVCVVSESFVEAVLSEVSDPIGERVAVPINNSFAYFYIVGVYAEEEDTSALSSMLSSGSTNMYLPISTVKKLTGASDGYQSITVVAASGIDTLELADATTEFFASFYTRNMSYTASASSMEEMLDTINEMLSTVTLAIAAIAAISLLVGGIGVMNIMLVSITERTREIGTRKALGATNGAIRLQFIVESMIICLIGGIIGILSGVGLGVLASNLLGYPARASTLWICIAVGFSMIIGVFFGYYPANKAAKMDPIEALRYE
ncbi:MAG: ABC transporter permease [Oscillospiraceae bacterium]|nr:ABC transporter permease [Oscillospiraceae bacterium]